MLKSWPSKISHWLRQLPQKTPRWWYKAAFQVVCHSIFWGWNGLFLLVVYLGFLPFIGLPLIQALATGEVPFPFVVPLVSFLAVPPVCSLVGLVKLRKHPTALLRLFYGIEAPIMVLSIIRMFVLRELTPASTLMVVAGAIAIATIILEFVFGYAAYHKGLARFQMVAHTVVLVAGLYVGAFLLFYTIPLLWVMLVGFLSFDWVGAILQPISLGWQAYQPQGPIDFIEFLIASCFQFLLYLGIFALFGFSTTLFIGMPYALVITFTQSWARIRHAFGQQWGQWQAWATTGGAIALLATLFLLTTPQPQTQTFAQLAQPPTTPATRQERLRQSPQIRRGLLNAYLMQYRYISSWDSANNLEVWYPSILPLTHGQAQIFQAWHNALLSPFLYQGDRTDPEKAADLYADFFDIPIQKAESAAIQHALQSTVERDSVEASLLNISDHVVALTRQEVTVKPAGDWAEITLFERYENLTTADQEIVYQFSLPESAVITGLWLGEADLAERYRFVVSPRGAAQRVYKQEIERAQQIAEDPALLEQVGPQQYRLRIFPIPQRVRPGQPGVTHLWMTYQVAQKDGAWPLPQLTEKRNLYWTKKTRRLRLGQKVANAADIWYEKAIPAASVVPPQTHQATLVEGYRVTAQPFTQDQPLKLHNQRLAVLIDTSRSMADRTADLKQALQELAAIAQTNTVDWFITSATGIPPQRLAVPPEVQDLSFFGSLPLTDQLQQLAELREESSYDATFMLTDAGNYELETDNAELPAFSGSLWLVHLGGTVPVAYTDKLQERLAYSQGGIADTALAAWHRFTVEQQTDGTVMDGYQWAIAPDPQVSQASVFNNFQATAARQVISWLSRQQNATQISRLDKLHAIAKRTEIVTPYSSMLVLVNNRQREALKAAENDVDRFEREIETGEDVLTNPGDPLNASVPENGTPLAILLVGSVFGWMLLRSARTSA